MNKISKLKKINFLLIILTLSFIASYFVIFSSDKVVLAALAPTVHIQFGDDQDSSPDVPQDCPQHVNPSSGPNTSATDTNDPDCLRIKVLDAPGAVFTEDFRICLRHSSGTRICTLYASEIGASPSKSLMTSAQNQGTLDGTITVEVDTRPLVGASFRNVSVGVAVAYQEDNGPCTASGGMFWASQGQTSGWAYSPRDNDPGCFQIGLFVSPVPSYNAEFFSTTLPNGIVVPPNTPYSGNIIMKNTGNNAGQWDSGRIISHSNPLCGEAPTVHPSNCSDTVTITSDVFKLYRTDNTPTLSAPLSLPYTQQVTYTYNSVKTRDCEQWDDNGGNTLLQKPNALTYILQLFSPSKVFARGGCLRWGTWYYEWLSTGQSHASAILANENATFSNVDITTPSTPGTYNLKYKMGTSPSEIFGQEADITLTIAGTTGLPTATTTPPSGVTSTTAMSGGNIATDGGSAIIQSGITWLPGNTLPTATLCNQVNLISCAPNQTDTGPHVISTPWTNQLTALTPNTLYTIRAYAFNANGVGYGNPVSFTTIPSTPGTVSGFGTASLAIVLAPAGTWIGTNGACVGGFIQVTWHCSIPGTCDNSHTEGQVTQGASCGGGTAGACSTATPIRHTAPCSVGTPIEMTSSPTRWTWKCHTVTGDSGQCVEKKSPGFIEN